MAAFLWPTLLTVVVAGVCRRLCFVAGLKWCALVGVGREAKAQAAVRSVMCLDEMSAVSFGGGYLTIYSKKRSKRFIGREALKRIRYHT